MVYVGIDPGASGGIAAVDETGTLVEVVKTPETERDLWDVLRDFGKGTGGSYVRRAVLERVWSSPQMGVASAFKFGTNVGLWRMALTAALIPFTEVTPGKWQKAMECLAPPGQRVKGQLGTVPGKDKNITKRRAQQLFPNVTVTHAIADALLLAEYARRVGTGLVVESEGAAAKRHKSESTLF